MYVNRIRARDVRATSLPGVQRDWHERLEPESDEAADVTAGPNFVERSK